MTARGSPSHRMDVVAVPLEALQDPEVMDLGMAAARGAGLVPNGRYRSPLYRRYIPR